MNIKRQTAACAAAFVGPAVTSFAAARVFAAIAVLMGVSAVASAAPEVKVYGGPTDEQITAAVRGKIAEFPELLAPNWISVQTLHKVVYLYGQVNTVVERNLAESVASQVEGVLRVVDSIALSDGGG